MDPVEAARVAAGTELSAWVGLWTAPRGFSPERRDQFLAELVTMLEGAADALRRERHRPTREAREATRAVRMTPDPSYRRNGE